MDHKKLGILGGGQLGRMMVEAGHRLGLNITILDEPKDCPAKQLSACVEHIHGAFRDGDCIRALKEKVDTITVEIEHIDCKTLFEIEQETPGSIHPTPNTLKTIQDKYQQKVHLERAGLPLPDFKEVKSTVEIESLASEWGYPIMLKAKTLAYDGRGNFVLKNSNDTLNMKKALLEQPDNFYVERWVPYVKELACMVVRSTSGEVASYPIVETIQKDNICHVVIAPAAISSNISNKAKKICEQAIKSFEGAGIFGVEMFLLQNDDVVVNEIAPRPHNSGHYTIEACHTSQFENHLRAVCSLPLGSTSLKVPCAAMINILGESEDMQEMRDSIESSLKVNGATFHWYGKRANRKGRKMGHVTVVANDERELKDRVAHLLAGIPGNEDPEGSAEKFIKLKPEVGVIMGSDSDLPVMKAAATILEDFGVPFELTIVSAHRTPDRMMDYAREAHKRGIKTIIAAAGGAAHLPGMVASMTPLPVIGVPIALKHLDGVDSLHSIVQMPRGVPCATVAINNSTNAALLAIRILGSFNSAYLDQMLVYQQQMKDQVLKKVDTLEEKGWKDY
ncbi:phosphoribosylaminoimidazole carboxylase [Neoconidiobolus thromboides FSU 785]|nr:phosphoribosylaminoimidazole carboxylase [Neoconidiobolus thromboides FSU 785]